MLTGPLGDNSGCQRSSSLPFQGADRMGPADRWERLREGREGEGREKPAMTLPSAFEGKNAANAIVGAIGSSSSPQVSLGQ